VRQRQGPMRRTTVLWRLRREPKTSLCPPVDRTCLAFDRSKLFWAPAFVNRAHLVLRTSRFTSWECWKEWRAKCKIYIRAMNRTRLRIWTSEFKGVLDHKQQE